MTKNSGRKKAARKYQQEHPGTTFPEAMRAVARPTTEAFSMPDGYILLDKEGVPTTFDPVAYTADFNASLLATDTYDALFPQADGAQWPPEQVEAIKLRQAEMVRSAAEAVREKWRRSNTAAAEVQAAINDLWQTRTPEEPDAEMGVERSAGEPRAIGWRKFGGVEFSDSERAEMTSWDGLGKGEFAEQQRSAWRAWAESRQRQQVPTENFMRHNEVMQAMTPHTVEDRPAT
ncbi:hypothetical protein [Rhodococcus erythropolis]|jgi:hypothetical protein|uniref:hypothetical protein n=1 Tax=Rhodococcus erythropolis TaxID=1833 RepID=UPI0022B313B3|nr:hypothetical protein [Rhodococcus erythropolis]MCZ4645071.1 hypothetical protein [Rhodococcus erythropolis]